MRRGRRIAIAVWALAALAGAAPAAADERIPICYNYGCAASAEVGFDDALLGAVRARLASAASAEAERALVAEEIGRLYRRAGEQAPISADRAGNFLDDGVDGKMDCIDHATSTTRLLQMLEARGALRFHAVAPVARRIRWVVAQHFSAVLEERAGPDAVNPALPRRFVIDSWFGEHGDPAVVLPLENWLEGEGPDVW